ncbi:putative aspartyl aminopeptidase [Filobasidium floriforme]|uniref:putative aspartyl aminopeptidase n=1 Tax=Filobasidium floriforme TaxID=5210 RepID=UPI001E8DB185|nr:putative aspartyl aminopeptidase [Filobasidium floriforme]KAH8084247.1 putative aspartyl aminopeptidase [Filobasidium floriforme]
MLPKLNPSTTEASLKKALGFLKFVDSSPTPFHAVQTASQQLLKAGFTKISERDDFSRSFSEGKIRKGGKYFYTRNQSSLVAFALPHNVKKVRDVGMSIVAGHTDSPCPKLRPISKKTKGSYLMAGVETYGGGIWATWFDRDLSIAGRVIVSDGPGQTYSSRLIKIDRPLFRIPTLAIHLDRTINESWKFNKETEFQPIMGLVSQAANAPFTATTAAFSESAPAEDGKANKAAKSEHNKEDIKSRHDTALLTVLAEELGVEVDDIQDFELSLYDTQLGSVSGLNNEFLHTARIDNLMTCYCSIQGLIESTGTDELLPADDQETNIRTVCLFDNEEVGSVSYQGAESDLVPSLVENLLSMPGYIECSNAQFLKNSFLISSDMGHALNPNFEAKYQEAHRPQINQGVIIKTNANQRYTSNASTTFVIRRVADLADVPLQEFEVRNDGSCGSTIGPAISTHGLRTVDIGLPQLSMHSIRETAGTKDPEYLIKLFATYFSNFSSIDKQLVMD